MKAHFAFEAAEIYFSFKQSLKHFDIRKNLSACASMKASVKILQWPSTESKLLPSISLYLFSPVK